MFTDVATRCRLIFEIDEEVEVTRAMLVFFALVLAAVPAAVVAQNDNEGAVALLPKQSTLGDGWALLRTDFPSERLPVFRAATTATYGGPHSARVILDALLVAEGMTAVRQSWEHINDYMDSYKSNMTLEFNYQRDKELEAMELPPGCSDARRVEGKERIGGIAFPIGVTLCAADPDILLVAAVSGEFNGHTGVAASDAVIELALAAQSATPTS